MNRKLGIGFVLIIAFTFAHGQSWTLLNNAPPGPAGNALLLTDGTVMVQEISNNLGTANWWRLTPDNLGSYQMGTWTPLATMPNITDPDPANPPGQVPYAPLYFASAVLPNGRVVVAGGEYNGGQGHIVETAAATIYDPVANSWTLITPPAGVAQIGDASSVILPNGTFMLGPCCNSINQWLLDPSASTWTSTGANKTDSNAEESWTLLPNSNVLTVDTAFGTNSEVYNPGSGAWSSAGSTIVALADSSSREIGPAVLRPDGTVFATGATGNTAIYNTGSGGWAQGPSFPSVTVIVNGQAQVLPYDVADGPAALLPNGNVLVDASPGVFHPGIQFFEFNGSNLLSVANPPNIGPNVSYTGRMLVLPTGEIMFTNQTAQVALYRSSGSYQAAWQPTISSISSTSLGIGLTNYSITGTQFNGLSQGAMYGDDAQSATNYPLIRITNNATGHVFYVRTHDHSTMAVATGGASVSTMFDVPGSVELGDSTLQVVVNGIPSNPYPVTVFAPRRRACC